MKLITRRQWATLVGAALTATRAAAASSFPTRPVRVIVPQAPGGAADQMIRLVATKLEALWAQSVLIDYRPGGGSVLATQTVSHSPPDGYTMGTAGSSMTINAVLRKDLPYKLSEVQPLARIGFYTTVLLAHPSVPANDVRELIALAKKTSFLYGSNGVGSAAHLAAEMLNQMAGIDMRHVPYNGASKMYTDMIGGRLLLGFSVASSAETFVKAGQLKVLGVTNLQRSPMYPQWPAIAETLPGYESINWAGLYGPAGVPREVVEKISADVVKVLRQPETRLALNAMGIDVAEQGAAEFAAFIKQDVEHITSLAKKLGPLE